MKLRFKRILVVLIIGLSLGCVDRFAVLANPPAELVKQVEAILPSAEKFVLDNQETALAHGIPLSSEFIEIAKKTGIKQADKVRIYPVNTLPVPNQNLRI